VHYENCSWTLAWEQGEQEEQGEGRHAGGGAGTDWAPGMDPSTTMKGSIIVSPSPVHARSHVRKYEWHNGFKQHGAIVYNINCIGISVFYQFLPGKKPEPQARASCQEEIGKTLKSLCNL
jgi:hypothetical protein